MWMVLGGGEREAACAEAFGHAMANLVIHPQCAPMSHAEVLAVGVMVAEYVAGQFLAAPSEDARSEARTDWLDAYDTEGERDYRSLAADVGERVIEEDFVAFRDPGSDESR